jgi:hypothetical protein
MEKAHKQAQTYARSLPAEEIRDGRPPFLLVVDVGDTLALYSEFSRTGGNYVPFPDPHSYRIKLDELHDANVRQLLRKKRTASSASPARSIRRRRRSNKANRPSRGCCWKKNLTR